MADNCCVCRRAKGDEKKEQLKTSVMGYMASSSPHGCFYVSPETIANNTSHHIWTELRAILRVAQEQGFLPRRLVLTEDNTCKENKSQERMLSLALLVHLDIFESVEVRYFAVGHTHWKMDQVFSVLSKAILGALLGYGSASLCMIGDHPFMFCFLGSCRLRCLSESYSSHGTTMKIPATRMNTIFTPCSHVLSIG